MTAEETPTTLATVAASAGVSVATVSKVLNGRADVGPQTRARVLELLEQLSYVERRADPTGSPSARHAPPTVEVVFHASLSAYAQEILQGVLDAAAETGVSVAVSLRPPRPVEAGEQGGGWLRQLLASGRRAVVDVVDDEEHSDLAGLLRSRLPLVVIDPHHLPRSQVVSVGGTNFAGGLAATEHLLGLGHRRIGFVGPDPSWPQTQARLHGYRAALAAAGVQADPRWCAFGGPDHADGAAAAVRLLDAEQPPTAVFAASDLLAAGVVEAARQRGLRVAEDLSVVGFDDTDVARLISPPLTTVRQPLREMGRVALTTALRLADGERPASHHVELATSLVVRGSTAPPARRGAR